jgi:hypothetical protein
MGEIEGRHIVPPPVPGDPPLPGAPPAPGFPPPAPATDVVVPLSVAPEVAAVAEVLAVSPPVPTVLAPGPVADAGSLSITLPAVRPPHATAAHAKVRAGIVLGMVTFSRTPKRSSGIVRGRSF